MLILQVLRIQCHEQEDWTGDDHAYIRVNGVDSWGPKSMDTGQTRVINKPRLGFRLSGCARTWWCSRGSPVSSMSRRLSLRVSLTALETSWTAGRTRRDTAATDFTAASAGRVAP